MNLSIDFSQTSEYSSPAQIARVLSETWVENNMYCPRCGHSAIEHLPNNTPVGDFICPRCGSQYELKSTAGSFGRKITDGAYDTMLSRIAGSENPDFFLMNYSKEAAMVEKFIFIPKHFFVPGIIEKRAPLSHNAKRSGWVGCNILIDDIPKQGRIKIIENRKELPRRDVIREVRKCAELETVSLSSRGWLFDILNCVNHIPKTDFSLSDIYAFEDLLQIKYPNNTNIRPKIRQQLQILRDKGYIKFLGEGVYEKVF